MFTCIILLLCLNINPNYGLTEEEEIDYYTNVVNNGIQASLNFQLPTNAEEYRPQSNTVTSK